VKHQPRRAAEILVVDDNPGDVRLTVEALQDGETQSSLHTARDGAEAMAFLHRKGQYGDAPRPDLILLDLDMPRMGGLQVLAEIRADLALKDIPVVILTGSHEIEDVARTYNLNANCYVTKPIDLEQFIKMVRSIASFWLVKAARPRRTVN
jgi:two-component system, chemotaxis family, response regulator Rcp1